MKRAIMVGLLLAVLAAPVWADTFFSEEVTCPLCGEAFSYLSQGSGSSYDRQLDTKKVGPIIDPWPVAVCPKCHLVVIDELSDQEMIEKIRPFIRSVEYQKLAEDNTSHFLLAKIGEFLQKSPYSIAYLYLQASWQMFEEKYPEYAQLSLDYFQTCLSDSIHPDEVLEINLICTDLERRTGQFAKAGERLFQIKQLAGADELGWIIEYQLSLIESEDKAAHLFSEAREAWQKTHPDSTD